jgi:CcmD family protein
MTHLGIYAVAAHAALAPPTNAHLTTFEKYTAAAYLVVFVGVLAYVLIIASKLQRLQRQVGELVERAREREAAESG